MQPNIKIIHGRQRNEQRRLLHELNNTRGGYGDKLNIFKNKIIQEIRICARNFFFISAILQKDDTSNLEI